MYENMVWHWPTLLLIPSRIQSLVLRLGLHDRSYFNIILNHSQPPNQLEFIRKELKGLHANANQDGCVSLRLHNQTRSTGIEWGYMTHFETR